jgi:prolyl-tRNA editing enzyme YbaK/EbsC (Cys-tRNA(Pro) deacylase)
MASISKSARRVLKALKDHGLDEHVLELPHSTRTAEEAAQAVQCDVAQICKSLVFKTVKTERPVLIITSGANRVDEKLIAEKLGERIRSASAADVRDITGFAIGGVAPVGLKRTLRTFIDRDLLQYEAIWAAAGTPHAVFRCSPTEMCTMTGGEVISVK